MPPQVDYLDQKGYKSSDPDRLDHPAAHDRHRSHGHPAASSKVESVGVDTAVGATLVPMITTRIATEADAVAIAELHVRFWQVAYAEIVPAGFLAGLDPDVGAEQWRRNLTEAEPADGTTGPIVAPTNIVAVSDGDVVGFACVGRWRESRHDAESGELWAMYVHPDQWGAGAGHALMNDAIALFRRRGVDTAHLWVLEDNERARRFYERQGWRADDVTRVEAIGGADLTERRYSLLVGGNSKII